MLLAAAGLAVVTGATPTSGYRLTLAALLLAGTGIGLAMAPATDSVMGSLPLAKASVGSAMNDTARLIGGAFGVAILGTTINQVYRTHITATADQLPPAAAAPTRDSLQAALQVAGRLDPTHATTLQTAARLAFTDAMNQAAIIAAVVAFSAALLALILLPTRSTEQAPHTPQRPRWESLVDSPQRSLDPDSSIEALIAHDVSTYEAKPTREAGQRVGGCVAVPIADTCPHSGRRARRASPRSNPSTNRCYGVPMGRCCSAGLSPMSNRR